MRFSVSDGDAERRLPRSPHVMGWLCTSRSTSSTFSMPPGREHRPRVRSITHGLWRNSARAPRRHTRTRADDHRVQPPSRIARWEHDPTSSGRSGQRHLPHRIAGRRWPVDGERPGARRRPYSTAWGTSWHRDMGPQDIRLIRIQTDPLPINGYWVTLGSKDWNQTRGNRAGRHR